MNTTNNEGSDKQPSAMEIRQQQSIPSASNTMTVEALAKGGRLDSRYEYKGALLAKMVSTSKRH
jgi:hypothetical protein